MIKMMSTVLHNVSVLNYQNLSIKEAVTVHVCQYVIYLFNKIYCLLTVVLCHFS